MAPVPLAPGEPTRLGDYWLAGKLGSGGQGVVYEGYGPDGVRVAVKALHGDYSAMHRELFVREVDAVRRVSQFCTARVLAVDLESAPPFIVSEYVAGPNLMEAVEEGGAYGPDELYRLAVGIATALTTIHRAGVVHRDLKPANVLLGPDGPRVIDFGIARTEDMSQSVTGIKGTPRYMAPEVFRGQSPGPAVDVWAWGATVLFAAAGRAPFDGDPLPRLMHAVLNTEPDVSVLPERLRPIVGAALAKEPERRPSASQVLLDLLGGGPDADLLEQGVQAAGAVRTPKAVAAAPTLGERAEAVFQRLSPAAQQAVPQVLLRMVSAGDDLVRPAAREEFDDEHTPGETIEAVLVPFAEAGLLVWDGRHFTIATPALLRAWPRLRDWVEAERSGLAVHQELVAAIRLWDAHGRKPGDLFQGTRLDRALSWAVSGRRRLTVSTAEQRFLDAGRAASRRRSTVRTAVSGVLAVLLVVAVGAGALVFQRGQTVARQRDEAEARRLAGVALATRKNDPRTARRLAVAAAALADTKETRETLVALLYQWESDVFAPPGVSGSPLRSPSRNGRVLVVVDPVPGNEAAGGAVSVWDVDTHTKLHAFTIRGLRIDDIAITDDARTLVTWAGDGTARVWDTATGKERGRLPIGKRGTDPKVFDGIDLGASGNLLFADTREARTVWDMRSLKQVPLSWARERRGVDIMSASDDGQVIAGVTPQGNVHIDQPAARKPIPVPRLVRALRGRYVGAARLSPDGSLLAVAHAPNRGKAEVLVWQVRTDTPLTKLTPATSYSALAFNQDGRFLAQGRTMWRLPRSSLSLPVPPVLRYAPGDGCALVRFVENRTLRCIEPATGQVLSLDVSSFLRSHVVQGNGLFQEAALSADGSTVAYRGGRQIPFWDVRRQRAVNRGFSLSDDYGYSGNDNGMVFSEDGGRFAIYKNARAVTITDARKFTALGEVALPGAGDRIFAMALSPDGLGMALLVRRGTGSEMQFWDLKTFRQIRAMPSAADTLVKRILFRSDGKAVLADGGSGLIEYPSGRVLAKSGDMALRSVLALSRDGRTVASSDGAEKVLLTDGTTLRSKGLVLRGHKGRVKAAAFSPDGTLLATGDETGQIRLWEVKSGRAYALALSGHQTEVWALAFSSDGRTLTSVSESGTVLTHAIGAGLTSAALCQSSGGLTRAEWKANLSGLDYRRTCPSH
ncbi:WD40 repeat domain-containing serine/threonine-protein kinase [Actinomadura rubrisoli]|uniref:Protein kinase domain-containing protein n=1 Tax=Actinomadura rubrisoli TaxID=2530368 RepID=A0A4R5C0C2_9ACTN|nr:WD40 repeat domain-containing serine/threonine-protein kinase [Actinomadura rubrisoli]TDD93008.1 hypothetical protein E1298_10355 [Actinomadura rubrisoli]